MYDFVDRDVLEMLLSKVEKPARYTGGEWNVIKKGAALTRFAFAFPDIYEVGMSYLGLKILYSIINSREDAVCERVFAPWTDMEELMRENDVPLYSLETGALVSGFDIVGFTLQYEMSYTAILNMLSLAKIPLLASDRGEGQPFIIAGGPCAYNPEPLADFIDIFVIGDGEEVICELLDEYGAWKEARLPREDFLLRAARISGVYVPRFYETSYGVDGNITSFTKTTNFEKPADEDIPLLIQKRIIPDLDSAEFPESIIVPYSGIIHDRIMLEICRGCTHGCRFCQAGMVYRPVRERSLNKLFELAEKLVGSTGYEELSLSSLSTGDYSCLPELVRGLMERFEQKRVSVSLPSLRIDSIVNDALIETQKVKKTGLTFAPEAGTQRLRDVINKGVTREDLIARVTDAFENGWSGVKLYFMIGLPTETDEDILGIASLARDVADAYYSVPKDKRGRGFRVTVSVACFVPKPHTPFQWEAQDSMQIFREKQRLLQDALRGMKFVTYNWHESKTSFLEAVFARGDRRLGSVLLKAHELGCRLDAWDEHFNFDRWMEAFEAEGVSPEFYIREREESEILPWAHIDAGVTPEFLQRERKLALLEKTTPDCAGGKCHACGISRLFGGVCPCE